MSAMRAAMAANSVRLMNRTELKALDRPVPG
jgi:hypothetical protein